MIESDKYLTIAEPAEIILKEKGSKFLAFVYPVDNEEDIKERLDILRKKYYDATHHCYAYIWGYKSENYRANDDGEPNNSAGMPILGQIRSAQLTNVLVVVVRYFGGTKLGVSGLIQAYKTSALEVLAQAQVIEKLVKDIISIEFDYVQMNEIMKLVKEYNLEIIEQAMDLNCYFKISLRKSMRSIILEKLNKLSINWGN